MFGSTAAGFQGAAVDILGSLRRCVDSWSRERGRHPFEFTGLLGARKLSEGNSRGTLVVLRRVDGLPRERRWHPLEFTGLLRARQLGERDNLGTFDVELRALRRRVDSWSRKQDVTVGSWRRLQLDERDVRLRSLRRSVDWR